MLKKYSEKKSDEIPHFQHYKIKVSCPGGILIIIIMHYYALFLALSTRSDDEEEMDEGMISLLQKTVYKRGIHNLIQKAKPA